ncbi:hypothetical protein [Rhodanobacter sp. OK091]|uniref:hypothetical protein n=1 Tax=Rhodanobacter sp. OK091 TaxID=1881037 RepID=UPI001160A58A|nr:hypothetical protein [Rhodanobacter sp. OK091]
MFAQNLAIRRGCDVGMPVVRVGDRWQVGYEIHAPNFSAERLTVTKFTVDDARDTIIELSPDGPCRHGWHRRLLKGKWIESLFVVL